MNIETANRLLQYRKQNHLSQEELAEKINVSRQAVSKWERAEASPDTDNLIMLAKIYGVSLDTLISGSSDAEESPGANETGGNNAEKETPPEEDKVSFVNGIHIHSKDGDKVDIGLSGVHIHDKNGDKVDVSWKGIRVEEGGEQVYPGCCNRTKTPMHQFLLRFPYYAIVTAAYILFGFYNICGGWAFGWMIFLTIPLYYTFINACYKRRPDHFAFPVLVVIAYLWMGFWEGLWHPGWVLFLSIPFYYCICEVIRKTKNYNSKEKAPD